MFCNRWGAHYRYQTTKRQMGLHFARFAHFKRHTARLFDQFVTNGINRFAPEVKTGFKRFFDARIEPGIDTFGDELAAVLVDKTVRKKYKGNFA